MTALRWTAFAALAMGPAQAQTVSIGTMIPANAFPGAVWTDVAGFVVGAGLIVAELGLVRRFHGSSHKAT